MQTQGSPRLRVALPALAIATAASILALAPTISIAAEQIKDGRNPKMTRVARDIVAAQQAEIAVLDRWLSAHELAASRLE